MNRHSQMLVLLILALGCSRGAVSTPEKTQDPAPKADPKPKSNPQAKTEPKTNPESEVKLPAITISDAEAKAAQAVKQPGWMVTVDERYPEKPIIGLFVPYLTYDEAMAAKINDLKHLQRLGGYDAKFKPGFLKLLKNHPTLEIIVLDGSVDSATAKELAEGPPIKELRLAAQKLSAADFEAIAKVTSLRSINMRLDGSKPDMIRPLQTAKNLESLEVAGFEPLTAEDIAGFGSLKKLTCTLAKESEPIFEALSKMKNLRTLHLRVMDVPGKSRTMPPGIPKLASLPELVDLHFEFPVDEATLKSLALLKNLESLECIWTEITADGIKLLQGFPKLTTLRLYATIPEGKPMMSDDAFRELKGLTNLKTLRLAGPLTETGAEAIGSLSNLESLTLAGLKPYADKAMPHIAKLTKLRQLDLRLSDMSDVGLKELALLKKLELLQTGGTKVTPAGTDALRQALPKLKIDTTHDIFGG